MNEKRGQLRRKLTDMREIGQTRFSVYPWFEVVCGYNNFDDDGAIHIVEHLSHNSSRTMQFPRAEIRKIMDDYENGERGYLETEEVKKIIKKVK